MLEIGQHDAAAAYLRQEIVVHRKLANGYLEAIALVLLGDTYNLLGAEPRAGEAWSRALVIFEREGRPEAGPLRNKLRRVSWRKPDAGDAPSH